MAKKQIRLVIRMASMRTEFEKLKQYLDDDEPVFLTFLNVTNYNDSKNNKKVMIKIAIEKAGG